MDEAPQSAPASPAPVALRPAHLGAVLREIREELELTPLVRAPLDEEPQISLDLLEHTNTDLPVPDPPRAIRPGRPVTDREFRRAICTPVASAIRVGRTYRRPPPDRL